MATFLHEALVALFRNRPELVAELLGGAVQLPASARYVARESELGEPVPSERRADVVFELRDETDAIRQAAVIEVQLSRDWRKRFSWPLYLMSLRSRIRAPVLLIVIAPRRKVARWASRSIDTGHPGFALRPIVIGPDRVPIATAEDVARAPELAVLSVIAHGNEPRLSALGEPLMTSLARLDDERSRLYTDLVLSAAKHELVRAALEAAMQKIKHEYQSDFARKHFSAGRAEALLSFLHSRGIAIDDAARERILSCREAKELDRWIALAASVEKIEDLFD